MLVDIHLVLVFATIAGVLFSDEQALLWILGRKQMLSASLISWLHDGVTLGLALLIITGGFLYGAAPLAYLSDTTFLIKIAAISALIINTYFINRLSVIAIARPYSATTRAERAAFFVSGAVSVGGWATAALCGYLLS